MGGEKCRQGQEALSLSLAESRGEMGLKTTMKGPHVEVSDIKLHYVARSRGVSVCVARSVFTDYIGRHRAVF